MTERNNKIMRISAIVLMSLMLIAIIVMAVFLGINNDKVDKYGSTLDNIYMANYYDIIAALNTMENELNKATVLSTARLQESSLEEVVLAANTAERALIIFANQTNTTRNLNKFINQTSDYSSYIIKKLENGEKMSDDERKMLMNMSKLSREVAIKMTGMRESMGKDFSFVQNLGSEKDIFGDILGQMNSQGGIEFPTLIYDGPFSDGVKDREAKGIHGEEISEQEALSMAAKYLSEYEVGDIRVIGNNEYRIPSYLIEAALLGEQERTVSLMIAKKGGMLLNMDIMKEINEPTLTVDDCKVVAEQYLDSIGIKNMKAVWATNNNSVVYINLCYYDNETVHYPDMIKVKVSLDTGEIIGYEGLNYAFNHYERQLDKPKLSKEDVILSAPGGMTEITCRLALIPMTTQTERLTYELAGKIGSDIYFIYVDAMTGEEVQIFRVIDSNEGELLM